MWQNISLFFVPIKKKCDNNELSLWWFNKFILLLRKGVYPYEYMDSWENFDETTLLAKEAFHGN